MRSHKRTKRPPRLRRIVPLAVVAGLGVAFLSGVFLMLRWIRSAECHAVLENKTSEAIGGKAEFGPLEWLWVGVSSPSVKMQGMQGGRPHTMEAHNVRAHLRLSSLMQGCWAVEEIAMDKARIHFAAALPSAAAPTPTPKPAALPARVPSWIPTVFVVEAVRSGGTDLIFDLPEGRRLELLGTKFEVYPEHDGARLEAHGGNMVWTQFPEFRPEILWARGRLDEGRLRLNGAELSFASGGSVSLEGEFPDKEGVSRIEVRCKGLSLAKVFPAAALSLGGTLSGEGRSSWTPTELRTMEGRVSLDDASVHGLPALDSLASFSGMEQFRNLSLKKASAAFSRSGSVTQWREILLEAPGLIKVTGAARVGDDGSLDGTFQAGVTTDIVRVIPMARELLSAEEHDGYFWMPVHVAGNLEHPTEDLRPRILTAIAAKAAGVIRGGLEEGMKFLGIKPDSPTNSPAAPAPSSATNAIKALEQGAGSVIDAVGGFLK